MHQCVALKVQISTVQVTVSWFIDYPRHGISVWESPALLISRKQHSMLGRTIKYPRPGALSLIVFELASEIIVIINQLKWLHREGGTAQPNCAPRGIVANTSALGAAYCA